jgi:hypothetical protein
MDYLLNLTCSIFASLGPINVYKDMLNNMVSLIDRVVMNYQNQTRINGIWGHVHYTFDTREYHLIGRAYIRLACMQTIQFVQFVFLVFLYDRNSANDPLWPKFFISYHT